MYMAERIGLFVIALCTQLGNLIIFLVSILHTIGTTKPKFKKIIYHMERIGIGSLSISILTGSFTGAVLALQSYIGFKKYGGQDFIGPLIALSMARELGPIMTGLMVAGRSGSAIAAEIGTMRITEQIDALKTLYINPIQYLIVPRIIAGTFMLPCLTLFSTLCGIMGGYVVAVFALGLNGHTYTTNIQRYLNIADIINGLIKACWFGFIFTWVGSFKGFYASGGARGVGSATTETVVMASILMLLANYILTALLF